MYHYIHMFRRWTSSQVTITPEYVQVLHTIYDRPPHCFWGWFMEVNLARKQIIKNLLARII